MEKILFRNNSRLLYIKTIVKILLKSLLLLPIPLFMAWFSYTVDVSSLFHGARYETDIALNLMAGNAMSSYDRMDERLVLSQLATILEEPYDTLALGSSRVLQLREDTVDAESFFNCGVSGADHRDILNSFYLFDRAEKLPSNLIIALDPWILSDDDKTQNLRADQALYNEFLSTRLDIPTEYEPPNPWEKYSVLFSPTYFQGNLYYYLWSEQTYKPPSIVTGDLYEQDTNIKLKDGSVLYLQSYRDAGPEIIEKRAREDAAGFVWLDEYREPDPAYCKAFDRFIQYAKSEDVNVIFLLNPYSPLVYNYATEHRDQFPGFFMSENWFISYAEENDIPLYGSYNPFVIGCTDEDFYDGLHLRGELIPSFFPGIEKVLEEQEEGTAKSPWLQGRVPVEYPTAKRIVAQRYAIAAPEVLTRMKNEEVNGAPCYILGRYENDSKRAILLARYAVSMDEGIIYRYDTDWNVWVVDPRFPD